MSKHNILTFEINRLIKQKYKHTKKEIWKTLLELCNPSRRRRITVNLSKIARYTIDNKIAVVPGKVLGVGSITIPLTVAALSFSQHAERKIESQGGKCLSIRELLEGEFSSSDLILIR